MKNLTVKAKLSLLVAVSVVGLLSFTAVAFSTLQTLQPTGPLYKDIKLGQAIVADYVPPAESISYVVAILGEMEESADRATTELKVAEFRQARKDFEERHAYYLQTVPEGKMKNLMVGSCYAAAHQWFDLAETEFVPAILKGNKKEAHDIRASKLPPHVCAARGGGR